MSEPARSFPPPEAGNRAAPGALRDWLAAMKAHVPAQPAAPEPRTAPEPRPDLRGDGRAEAMPARADALSPRAEPVSLRGEAKPLRAVEAGWSPRLVPPAEAPRAEDPDVAELMAENLMLKAKLKVEADRQDALQTALAEQIRELRQHVAEEVASLEDLRAEQEEVRAERDEFRAERERFRIERDDLRAERDRAATERDALRAERGALAAERDALREERDLWRARTEALAQPLFQTVRR